MTDRSAWKSRAFPGRCWSCGAEHDRLRAVTEDTMPEPEDVTLCFTCGEWSIFTGDLSMRKPTDEEFEEIAAADDCRNVRLAWVRMDAKRRGEFV